MIKSSTGILASVLLLAVAGCGDNTCDVVEEQLDRCDIAYYGDDNCELLLERCTDDDLIVVETLFECFGNRCEDGAPIAQCDIHINRLSRFCSDDLSGQ